MEIPLKVIVKIAPEVVDGEKIKIKEFADCENATIKIDEAAYNFAKVYSSDLKNQDIYNESVQNMVTSALEGYDFSIVSYGQSRTGKSYTLFGGESDDGIVTYFIKDLFYQLSNYNERAFSISVAWSEITCDGEIIDILDNMSLVQCISEEEVYNLISIGLNNKSTTNHSILSLILEQQWTCFQWNTMGLNQHRQSTISFCDLTSTNRIDGVLKDSGLRMLEEIVLRDLNLYADSTLTTILKDSFGGRSQTMIMLCISELEKDKKESESNLKFAFKAQNIINHVVMNTFSDNNIPICSFNATTPMIPGINYEGLNFASQQWLKLLKNAESLLHKLFSNCDISQNERNQIEEWLYLKAECDECCLSSTEISINQQNRANLVPIMEIEEIESEDSNQNDDHHTHQNNHYFSDNESDSDICAFADISEKINFHMKNFETKNNNLINDKYKLFFQEHPRITDEFCDKEKSSNATHNQSRRKSIFDADTSQSNSLLGIATTTTTTSKKLENLNNNLRICITGCKSLQGQIDEIKRTIKLKQKYFTDLVENSETRTFAKNRFNKKKSKLESEYEKTKKQLRKAVVNGMDKKQINHLKCQTSQIEQRLQDLESIGYIAGESGHKSKKLQQSIKDSQKQLEQLQKLLKKEIEKRDGLEKEISAAKKEKTQKSDVSDVTEGKSKIKNMNERISHLEHVLKEKSSYLKKYVNKHSSEKDSLRQEIHNLRRTRDHLLEQRFELDKKIREDRIPSFDEERKLVECDEAIEAIDAAIELKNELICGRKSIDTDESLQREKGEQMLMARLNKLSVDEMRTLLYKYFQKVVDLKESSKKLEIQFINLEREKDAWLWQEKVLTNAIRQTRLENERNIIALQKQHETKLNLMLRHFAADTSGSISSTNAIQYPTDLDMLPSTSRYPSVQYKTVEKDRDRKSKLFSKIQLLTRYHGDKRKMLQADIPQENLKQLQVSSRPSLTKVTREKNKIIIHNDTMNK